MATKTVVCPACDGAVPHGRLSCPSCGTLLASVGISRSLPVGAYVPPPPPPATASEGPPARFAARRWVPGATAVSNDDDAASPSVEAAPVAAAPVDRVEQAAGWVTAAGTGLAGLGFLLPWSSNVIGATGFGSYLDRWGLASPTHVVVFVAILAVLGLAVVATPIESWFRSGLLAVGLGGLLLGLVWPYAPGPLGAGPGVLAVVVGALLLLAAGATTAWTHRHGSPRPTV